MNKNKIRAHAQKHPNISRAAIARYFKCSASDVRDALRPAHAPKKKPATNRNKPRPVPWEDVLLMREECGWDVLTYPYAGYLTEKAKKYGISRDTLRHILTNKQYKRPESFIHEEHRCCSTCRFMKPLSHFTPKQARCRFCSRRAYNNPMKIEERREKNRSYLRKRRKADPLYAIKCRMRTCVAHAFSKRAGEKPTSTEELVGCSFEFLCKYLESHFQDGMSWDNRNEWHIDHIIPLSLASNEYELKTLFHYTNLQPMWAEDNLSKSDNVDLATFMNFLADHRWAFQKEEDETCVE